MVKKIGMVLLYTAALGTSLLARGALPEAKTMIGLEIGSAKIQAHNIYSPIIGELDYVGQNIEYGFKIGAEKEDWRAFFVANFFDSSSDDDQKYMKGLIEVDYYLMKDSALKPFIGLNVGYINYETTDIDEDGLLYGGQVGVQYDIVENISIDLMYRYSLVNTDNVDHVEGIIFGLNYVY